jgi:hypothetical protein
MADATLGLDDQALPDDLSGERGRTRPHGTTAEQERIGPEPSSRSRPARGRWVDLRQNLGGALARLGVPSRSASRVAEHEVDVQRVGRGALHPPRVGAFAAHSYTGVRGKPSLIFRSSGAHDTKET